MVLHFFFVRTLQWFSSTMPETKRKKALELFATLRQNEIEIVQKVKDEESRRYGWVRIFPTSDSWDSYRQVMCQVGQLYIVTEACAVIFQNAPSKDKNWRTQLKLLYIFKPNCSKAPQFILVSFLKTRQKIWSSIGTVHYLEYNTRTVKEISDSAAYVVEVRFLVKTELG